MLFDEFERRGPWVTRFEIDGTAYGGAFDAMNDARIDQFFSVFPDVRSVLELGSLEGGHTFAIAQRPSVERITAVEFRRSNIDKALFVQALLQDEKAAFVEADLETADLETFGTFDAVFCSGLLYHLREPWDLIERCGKISPRIFIWTHYAAEREAKKSYKGRRGRWYHEGGLKDALSGASKYSYWLSLGELIDVLTAGGFDDIRIIANSRDHPAGRAVTLSASKSGSSSPENSDNPRK